MLMVALQPGAQDPGVAVAVAPAGNPEKLNVTVWAVPDSSDAVSEFVTEAPCTTLRAPPVARLKSNVELATVTVTVADVVVLLDVSRAMAASVCVPLATVVVFQERE